MRRAVGSPCRRDLEGGGYRQGVPSKSHTSGRETVKAVQQLKKGQEKRRQQLASRYFGNCTDYDYMVAEKGKNGVVRAGETVVIKATHGGAFRKPTFNVIRTQYIYGVTYDQSVGAEEVTMHTAVGDITWNVYGASGFVVRLLGITSGDSAAELLDEALWRARTAV